MMNKKPIGKFTVFFVVLLSFFNIQKAIDLTTAGGIKLHIISDKKALYFHSEILVRFQETRNTSISYLTFLNLFNEKVVSSRSSLLSLLFKMGNDFELIYNVDHIVIRGNFLKDRVPIFIQFLKKLSGGVNFSLKNFSYSLKNFKDLFISDKNRRKIIASQIALREIFSKSAPTKEFILSEVSLKKINLSQIRSFYKKNFILPNLSVAIRGNINPYIFLGLTEKAFKNFNRYPIKPKFKPDRELTTKRKIIIVNIGKASRRPEIFWFIPVPPKGTEEYNIMEISNNILFGYPFGTVFRVASKYGIRNIRSSRSFCDFQNISFICNRISLNRYSDLRKFFFIANNSFRKLLPGRISKKEYLSSYNNIYLAKMIASDSFDYIAKDFIKRDLLRSNQFPLQRLKKRKRDDLSYVSFNKYIEVNSGKGVFFKRIHKGVIVIIGNSTAILRNLNIKNAEVINVYHKKNSN